MAKSNKKAVARILKSRAALKKSGKANSKGDQAYSKKIVSASKSRAKTVGKSSLSYMRTKGKGKGTSASRSASSSGS